MKESILLLAFCFLGIHCCYSQKADTVKRYFIITAGEQITAYYDDKPLSIETSSQFTEYIQKNAKNLKDSWVVVTGKPKVGTFDDVIKTLNRYRFKHVSKNILKD
jgi:hypothetical protein